MSKTLTIGDVLSDPPRMESDIVKRMTRNVRKFDEYEENDRAEFSRCVHCPDKECNLHPINKLTWSNEHRGFLCGGCLKEEADRKNIIENEKKLHHNGGL